MGMRTHRKRPQAQKPREFRTENPRFAEEMHALGSSNATQPHRNKKKYHRPSQNRQEWS
jgi:hypothetical protein